MFTQSTNTHHGQLGVPFKPRTRHTRFNLMNAFTRPGVRPKSASVLALVMSRHRAVQNMLKYEDFDGLDDDDDEEDEAALLPRQRQPAKTSRAMPKAAAPKPKTAAAEVERRIDVTDGNAYTRAEFIEEYGGTREWDLAKPAATQKPLLPAAKPAAAAEVPWPPPGLAAPLAPSSDGAATSAYDAALEALIAMGFGADQARAALVATGDDVDAAVQQLLSGALRAIPAPPPSQPPPKPSAAEQRRAPPAIAATPAVASSFRASASAAAATAATARPPPLELNTAPVELSPPSEQLNMVVIGHVDAGKSTLMGRLLVHCGEVDQRTMHKYVSSALEWL